ncbi:g9548 [Coccomyxa viridis]|uniref:G9548 protein n=1 Tax=Coccomyxa viridis TaxID=1274662 RepID=A0ABP1G5W6_9CHLO
MKKFDEPPDWEFTSEEDEVEEQQALDRRQLLECRIETLIKDRSVLCERIKETDNRVNRLHALADALEHWAAVLAEYNARLGTKRASLQRAHSSS